MKIWYENEKLFRTFNSDFYDLEITYFEELIDADIILFEMKLKELKISSQTI